MAKERPLTYHNVVTNLEHVTVNNDYSGKHIVSTNPACNSNNTLQEDEKKDWLQKVNIFTMRNRGQGGQREVNTGPPAPAAPNDDFDILHDQDCLSNDFSSNSHVLTSYYKNNRNEYGRLDICNKNTQTHKPCYCMLGEMNLKCDEFDKEKSVTLPNGRRLVDTRTDAQVFSDVYHLINGYVDSDYAALVTEYISRDATMKEVEGGLWETQAAIRNAVKEYRKQRLSKDRLETLQSIDLSQPPGTKKEPREDVSIGLCSSRNPEALPSLSCTMAVMSNPNSGMRMPLTLDTGSSRMSIPLSLARNMKGFKEDEINKTVTYHLTTPTSKDDTTSILGSMPFMLTLRDDTGIDHKFEVDALILDTQLAYPLLDVNFLRRHSYLIGTFGGVEKLRMKLDWKYKQRNFFFTTLRQQYSDLSNPVLTNVTQLVMSTEPQVVRVRGHVLPGAYAVTGQELGQVKDELFKINEYRQEEFDMFLTLRGGNTNEYYPGELKLRCIPAPQYSSISAGKNIEIMTSLSSAGPSPSTSRRLPKYNGGYPNDPKVSQQNLGHGSPEIASPSPNPNQIPQRGAQVTASTAMQNIEPLQEDEFSEAEIERMQSITLKDDSLQELAYRRNGLFPGLEDLGGPELPDFGVADEAEIIKMKELIHKYKDAFSKDKYDIGRFKGYKAKIRIKQGASVREKERQHSDATLRAAKPLIEGLMKAGIIRKATAEEIPFCFSSNFLIQEKPEIGGFRQASKADKALLREKRRKEKKERMKNNEYEEKKESTEEKRHRYLLDFRRINDIVEAEPAPTFPHADILHLRKKGKYAIQFDLCQSFFCIPLDYQSQLYTGVWYQGSLLLLNSLPQGLKISSSIQQAVIQMIFSMEMLQKFKTVRPDFDPESFKQKLSSYSDDFIYITESRTDILLAAECILWCLREKGMKISMKKSSFFQTKYTFLGSDYDLEDKSIQLPKKRVDAVLSWPTPKSLLEVQSRLAQMSYHSSHLPAFKIIALPLYKLVKEGSMKNFGLIHLKTFFNLKFLFCLSIALTLPDPEARMLVSADASSVGISCVSLQLNKKNKRLEILSMLSRLLSKGSLTRSILSKECLASSYALEKNKILIEANKNKVFLLTDSAVLQFVRSYASTNQPIQSFSMLLSQYHNVEVVAIPSAINLAADLVSRTVCGGKPAKMSKEEKAESELINSKILTPKLPIHFSHEKVMQIIHSPPDSLIDVSPKRDFERAKFTDSPIQTITDILQTPPEQIFLQLGKGQISQALRTHAIWAKIKRQKKASLTDLEIERLRKKHRLGDMDLSVFQMMSLHEDGEASDLDTVDARQAVNKVIHCGQGEHQGPGGQVTGHAAQAVTPDIGDLAQGPGGGSDQDDYEVRVPAAPRPPSPLHQAAVCRPEMLHLCHMRHCLVNQDSEEILDNYEYFLNEVRLKNIEKSRFSEAERRSRINMMMLTDSEQMDNDQDSHEDALDATNISATVPLPNTRPGSDEADMTEVGNKEPEAVVHMYPKQATEFMSSMANLLRMMDNSGKDKDLIRKFDRFETLNIKAKYILYKKAIKIIKKLVNLSNDANPSFYMFIPIHKLSESDIDIVRGEDCMKIILTKDTTFYKDELSIIKIMLVILMRKHFLYLKPTEEIMVNFIHDIPSISQCFIYPYIHSFYLIPRRKVTLMSGQIIFELRGFQQTRVNVGLLEKPETGGGHCHHEPSDDYHYITKSVEPVHVRNKRTEDIYNKVQDTVNFHQVSQVICNFASSFSSGLREPAEKKIREPVEEKSGNSDINFPQISATPPHFLGQKTYPDYSAGFDPKSGVISESDQGPLRLPLSSCRSQKGEKVTGHFTPGNKFEETDNIMILATEAEDEAEVNVDPLREDLAPMPRPPHPEHNILDSVETDTGRQDRRELLNQHLSNNVNFLRAVLLGKQNVSINFLKYFLTFRSYQVLYEKTSKRELQGYVIRNNLLYKKVDSYNDDNLRLCLPNRLARLVIRHMHYSDGLHTKQGHLKNLFERNFCLLTRDDSIFKSTVASCQVCLLNAPNYIKKQSNPLRTVNPTRPYQQLSADIMSALPETEEGNCTSCLIIADTLTSFVMAIGLKDNTSLSMIKAFSEVFKYFSIPSVIITDHAQYWSSDFTKWITQLGVTHLKIVNKRSNETGAAERNLALFREHMSKFVQSGDPSLRFNWNKFLFLILKGFNDAPRTGFNVPKAQLFRGAGFYYNGGAYFDPESIFIEEELQRIKKHRAEKKAINNNKNFPIGSLILKNIPTKQNLIRDGSRYLQPTQDIYGVMDSCKYTTLIRNQSSGGVTSSSPNLLRLIPLKDLKEKWHNSALNPFLLSASRKSLGQPYFVNSFVEQRDDAETGGPGPGQSAASNNMSESGPGTSQQRQTPPSPPPRPPQRPGPGRHAPQTRMQTQTQRVSFANFNTESQVLSDSNNIREVRKVRAK